MALTRLKLSQTARPVEVLAYWRREQNLELSPPYQRGDVWGVCRQRNFIRSLLLGVPIASLIINDRFDAGWGSEIAVIDGKQRITAVLAFLDGNLAVPGEWFGLESDLVTFNDISTPQQRSFRNIPIQVSEGQLKSLEQEIEVFELVNFGGVPQGHSDESPAGLG